MRTIGGVSGDISVDAGDELNVNADVMAAGETIDIDLLANTALTMAAGTTATTNNGDAQISGGRMLRWRPDGAGTGDVAVLAGTGSVTDADADANPNVSAASLMIEAGVGIGTGADAIETSVTRSRPSPPLAASSWPRRTR